MKVLWKHGNLEVGWYDKDNFYVGERKKDRIIDATYHRHLKDAVRHAILENIGRKASSLEEYAKMLCAASGELEQALNGLDDTSIDGGK